jgi:alpha-D-xyloside xylohydrolase
MKRHLLAGVSLFIAACGSSTPSSSTISDDDSHQTGATVVVDATQIVLNAMLGKLVVQRAPFQMRFFDAHGDLVLSEVDNANAAPVPIAAVVEPAPLGAELPKTPSLYAPLAFVVGAQALPQIPAGPWEANALVGTAAGIAFQATQVADVQAFADHAVLTVTTDDPSGRVLRVRISQAQNGGIRISVAADPADGVALISDTFAAAADDAFRGFGGRHNALDQRGNDFLGWVMQQNTGAGELQSAADLVPGGDSQYLFPNGKTAAYYVSPSFIAPRYAFLLERDELSRWRMASDRDDAWQVQLAASGIDFSVMPGAPLQSLPALTKLTGRHRAPPAWALGVMFDRLAEAFTQTPAQYEAEVRDDLTHIDALQLPVSGYRIEGWYELAPEARGPLIEAFKSRGIRTLTYFRSFAAVDAAGTEDSSTFTEALTNNYVADTALGTPYIFGGNFFGPSLLVDFTNPAAVAWWQARIKAALDEGADGFMQDFGEQALGDMAFADGRGGALMHNRYPALYHRATREAIDEWRVEHPGHDDIWFFTRAGYAGLDGSPHDEGGNFAGDGNTDFLPASGLQSQTPDMLNRGLAGAWGFTTDIGGYFDFVTPATTKELFIRWAQWATLSPFMRLHGSIMAGTHMPWTYDDETVAIWKSLSELRVRAAPYILATWQASEISGLPVARPLWLMFPGDATAAAQMQEWILGDDVLVAPVVEAGATARNVYFPEGCWEAATGERFTGPVGANIEAPLNVLPYFFRCGTRPF